MINDLDTSITRICTIMQWYVHWRFIQLRSAAMKLLNYFICMNEEIGAQIMIRYNNININNNNNTKNSNNNYKNSNNNNNKNNYNNILSPNEFTINMCPVLWNTGSGFVLRITLLIYPLF